MANSDINKRKFDVVGELVEDCSSIKLDHHKPLRRVLSGLVGKKLAISIESLKYQKSLAQLRWIWGVAYIRIASFLKETSGVKYSKEEVHDYTTQQTLNNGSTGQCIVMEQHEFESFVDDFIILMEENDPILVRNRVLRFSDGFKCNVGVTEILGKRVVVSGDKKRLSKLTTVQFNDLKDKLQKEWSERGCDIPDPRENNFLSDFLKDE